MTSKNITPSFSHLRDLIVNRQVGSAPATFMWGGLDWVKSDVDSIVTNGEFNTRIHYKSTDFNGGKYHIIVAKCMPTFTFSYDGKVKVYRGDYEVSPSFALDIIDAIKKFSK